MTSAELIDHIVEQIPRQEVIESFVAACNRRDTLFITERWFAPRKEKLLALLSDPITADEAHVLRELLWQRISFEDVFAWLNERPLSWGGIPEGEGPNAGTPALEDHWDKFFREASRASATANTQRP